MGSAEQKYIKPSEIIAYSAGLFGMQAIVGYINSYFAEFTSATMFVDLAFIGILILAAKTVSAVFDLIIGNSIDRKNSKKGKLKPFIGYSLIPFAALTVVLFIKVPFRGSVLYAYIFILFLAWSLALTLGEVPSFGLASVMTPNPTERTNVVSISNTLKAIGFSAPYVIVPVVCLLVPGGSQVFGYSGDKDTPISGSEYLFAAAAVGILGCLLFSLVYFKSKERVPYKTEKMTFAEMFRTLKDNKPFLLVIVSYFLGFGRTIATCILIQSSNALLGSQNYAVFLGILSGIGSVLSMALTPILVKKFNEERTFIGMSLFGFVVSLITYLIGTENRVLMFVFLFLVGLQCGALTLMPVIMTADCVDDYELKTGKRTEGISYAVLSMTIKLGLALATALGLISLRISGYTAGAEVFSEVTQSRIYFAYTALPGIFCFLAAIPIFKYNIVGKKKLDTAEKLQERRGQ